MGKLSWLDDAVKGAARNLDEAARKIQVYHGTPHKFPAERLVEMPDGTRQWLVGGVDQLPDIPEGAVVVKDAPLGRFRMDKIGAGEGAQAYGHGLYTAESKGTAQWYRDNLSDYSPTYKGIPIDDNFPRKVTGDEAIVAMAYRSSASPYNTAEENIRETIRLLKNDFPESDGWGQDWEKIVSENIENLRLDGGSLYTSEIPDGDYLLWDKPLSEQPESVQKAVLSDLDQAIEQTKEALKTASDRRFPVTQTELRKHESERSVLLASTGKEIHDRIANVSGGQQSASEVLRSTGIPGIKYLDGTSRSAGEGAYNYVLFDEDLIDIKERGKIDPRLLAPIGAAAAGAGALMASQDSQAGVGDDIVKGVMRGADDAANQLDMSTAARMQRAAEQGFDTSMPLYHGTGAVFTEFDPLKMGKTDDGWFGKGFYLSPDPNVSNQYTDGPSPNVIKAYAKANNPYDWRANEGAGMRLGTADERYQKTREILEKGHDSVDVYDYTIKGDSLSDEQWTAYVNDALRRGDPVLPRDMVEQSIRAGISRGDFVKYYGEELANQMPFERTLKERVVFDPASIRSVNAAFDPKNIGKNDLLGAATIGGMATAGAVGAGLMGAQAYDFGTPDYDAKIQEFRNRRAAKSQIWKELKEAGATIASAIPAGIISDAYRIGGYLSPVTPVEETERGAEIVQNALMYTPEGDNRYLNEFARQVNQFGQDVEPLVNAWKQTPIYRGYKQLPQRIQGLIKTASDYAF